MLRRYTASKKYAILCQIDNRELTMEQAQEKHCVSKEEIAEWRKMFAYHGIDGLRSTKIQKLREAA